MPFGMLSNSAQPIALDFGVGSLKALQLSPGDHPALVAAALLETPDELRKNHAERLKFQLQNIPKLLKGRGFRGKKVVCSIPASQTLVQHMQLQKADGVNLQSLIAAELHSTLNCDPSRVVIRHFELPDARQSGNKTEVLCLAVAKDVVLKQVEALNAQKYEVVGVHSEQHSIIHAFDHITRRAEDAELTSLYLDIGAGSTKVVVAHGTGIVFAKTIHVAGHSFDESIASQMKCDQREARARRLTMELFAAPQGAQSQSNSTTQSTGAPSPLGESGGLEMERDDAQASQALAEDRRTGQAPSTLSTPIETDGAAPPEAPCDVQLNGPLEALTDEVAMCLRYHSHLYPDRRVNRAIFLGGESRYLGLCQHLARALRLPARVADPFAALKKSDAGRNAGGVDLTIPQPGWAVPYGLCMCPADS